MALEYLVSKKYHEISMLAGEIAGKVSQNGEEWMKYLTTAARLYRYPFEDQMLIYAQRPDATACATMKTWNDRMFCWVNRGAKGIALFDRDSERPRLKYVFDVSDVHKLRRIGKAPYLWEIREEHKDAVLAWLEKTYGATNSNNSFEDRLIEIAERISEDYYRELLADMSYAKEGSFLEELDELNVGIRLRETLSASIAYTLLSRCGADMDIWKDELNFDYISEFNTAMALSVIGNAASEMCKPLLIEIGRAVAAYDRQNARNRAEEKTSGVQIDNTEKNPDKTLANASEPRYNALKRESENEPPTETSINHIETEGAAYGTDIREERRLSDTQPDTEQRAGGGADEVRSDAQKIPEGIPEGDLQRTVDDGQTERALSGNSETGRGENGLYDRTDGESRGSGRGDESFRSDDVGAEDEQHQSIGGGTGTERTGIQLVDNDRAARERADKENTNKEDTEAAAKQTEPDNEEKSLSGFPLSEEESKKADWTDIEHSILQYDEFMLHKCPEIAGYFLSEQDAGKRAEFVKNSYRMKEFTEFYIKEGRAGYRATNKGLEMWTGNYLKKEASATIPWNIVSGHIAYYMERGEYLKPGQMPHYEQPKVVYEQLSLFPSLEEQMGTIAAAQASVKHTMPTAFSIPQDRLDAILRSGGGKKNSRKRIYAKYLAGKSPEDMAEFIKKEYGTTGKGFYFNDDPVSVWFDESGMRIGYGTSAKEKPVASYSWQEVEQNIRAMVENGTYMSAGEAFLVDAAERERITQGIHYFFLNGMGEYPEALGVKSDGFSENLADIKELLSTKEGIDKVAQELMLANEDLNTSKKKLKWNYVKRPMELLGELSDLRKDKIKYPLQNVVEVLKEDFITQDEIDTCLCAGSGIRDGKFRIYEYFRENHSQKENIEFLKNEYGTGSRPHALPGNDSSHENHDAKGIRLDKGSNEAFNSEVLLNWNVAEKRIRELVEADKYLTPKGKEQYEEYKKEKAKEALEAEQERIERSVREQCRDAIDEAIKEKFDGRILPGDTAVGVIKEFGMERVEYILANTITHLSYDGRFSANNKEWAKGIVPNQDFSSGALIVRSHPAVLDGFTSQARSYIERVREAEKTKESEMPEGLNTDFGRPYYYRYFYPGQQDKEAQEYQDKTGYKRLWASDAQGMNGDTYVIFRSIEDLPAFLRDYARNEEKREEREQEKEQKPDSGQFQKKSEPDKSSVSNFHITNPIPAEASLKEKFRWNISAIKLLQQIESENRYATPEEQQTLSKYIGWGGLSDAFDETKKNWTNEYRELKELLTPEEYASARASTLNAHYTSPTVIKGIYHALEKMGFSKGNILEPSVGIGNFFGMLPPEMAESRLYGVELDGITGRIAKQLYPHADIEIKGFEDTAYPDDFFDVAIGNVPFGSYKVGDKKYDKHNFLVHDYFFAKSIDKVRQGGIIAMITTNGISGGTFDKRDSKARRYIAQKCDLMGAIRLPSGTFADTELTTDIIFLKKREKQRDLTVDMPEWVQTTIIHESDHEKENGEVIHNIVSTNNYFLENPEMVLGKQEVVSGPFGPQLVCTATEGSLEEKLENAITHIEGQIEEAKIDDLGDGEDEPAVTIPADPDVKNFSFTIVDNKVYYRENSIMKPVKISDMAAQRIRGMVGIRNCTQELLDMQLEEYPDDAIKEKQGELNRLYDSFSRKYGLINSLANKQAFNQDSSYCLLCSLEKMDDEGNYKEKADMFTKRTIKRVEAVTSVDTASEALAVSLSEKAKVDIDYMAMLAGKGTEEIVKELHGVIFKEPITDKWETADEYLSGNVREKLTIAETYAENHPEFTINAEALKRVQPKELDASEIEVRIGATWVEPKYIEDFMREILGTPEHLFRKKAAGVLFSEVTGEWRVKGKNADPGNSLVNVTFGTNRRNAYTILEDSLNLKDSRVYDTIKENGKETRVLNKKETMLASQKQEAIREAFKDWIFSDPQRRRTLVEKYNTLFNSTRPREYDGSHLQFPGMTPDIELQPHQKNAVAHVLYGGNTLLAHCVGAGKTYEMAAAAMESKRLGLCQKSLFVVPNHLTEQWASDFLRLYPGANILAATKKDFEPANRKKFCSRIATGDYDAVIIGHTQFEKIPLSMERQIAIIKKQINEITEAIAEVKAQKGERYTIKQMEKSRKSLQLRLGKLNDQSRKDNVVTFEQLGVDRLFVDESHYYKNLFLYTKMRNVAGIAQAEAQKSSDMFAKCQYLDEITGGKGITFATGTPISNSMTELYTNMRYLQYNTLQRMRLGHFDSWASAFGENVTAVELAPEGTGYRAKTRFARFFNLPELIALFKECADIKTADMLNLPVPEVEYVNAKLKPSEFQKEMVESLADRAEDVRNRKVDASVDNMLKITHDGRKLALDQRLINPLLPDDINSKTSVCAEKAFEIWEKTKEQKSAQLIFSDLSTPKGKSKEDIDWSGEEAGYFENVYKEIKRKLVEKGVPPEEIAFIHDANTDAKKAELFSKVRTGKVRFLLGSTQKMGAGTNVQDRLIALHHLDVPWRPADIEQREGRILRQFNLNPKVKIFRYITEGTFDAYSWQVLENKAKFINQIMTSKSPVRSCEDIDETALTYAEIKALATGNPYIKEKMELDIQVSKLKLMKANHTSQIYRLEDNITKNYPRQIAENKERVKGLTADIEHYRKNKPEDKDSFTMTVADKVYTDKKEAGIILLGMCQQLKGINANIDVGEYLGFKMNVSFDAFDNKFYLKLKGQRSYKIELGTDAIGNITRINNAFENLTKHLEDAKNNLSNVEQQLENAKIEVNKPFEREQELSKKMERLAELNALLNMDEKDNDAVIMEDDAPQQKEEADTLGHDDQKKEQSVTDKPVQRVSLKEKLEAYKAQVAETGKINIEKTKRKEETL